jgi:uncharacterized protein
MKYALLITQNCNLACKYCYVSKKKLKIDLSTAQKAVDFIFRNSGQGEKICFGFFGGEPFLEFERLKQITLMIEKHPCFPERNIEMQVTSNGTIFSDEIAEFLNTHNIGLGISFDGIPEVQNANRRYTDGRPTARIVEENVKKAIDRIPGIMVNAVFTSSTFRFLPESVEYFYTLGLRKIFINPDFSSDWRTSDIEYVGEVYRNVAAKYVRWHENNDPAFISLIDGKIIVILNRGYNPDERCHMGSKEFAIAPDGNIFPCERLVGDGTRNEHCIGNIYTGVDYSNFCNSKHFGIPAPSSCFVCSLKKYCMNWCGCSNYFSTGNYNVPGPFICASEKAAINAAFGAFEQLEDRFGVSMLERLSNNRCEQKQNQDILINNALPK